MRIYKKYKEINIIKIKKQVVGYRELLAHSLPKEKRKKYFVSLFAFQNYGRFIVLFSHVQNDTIFKNK